MANKVMVNVGGTKVMHLVKFLEDTTQGGL